MDHQVLDRASVRKSYPCPLCGASIGEPCTHTGKGAARKHRLGVNHRERVSLAEEFGLAPETDDSFSPIDYDDDPATWELPVDKRGNGA